MKINIQIPLFVLILIFALSGCIEDSIENSDEIRETSSNAGEVLFEENIEPNVFFCPKDNCSRILEGIINAAENSVSCAFFDFDLENVIKAMGGKSNDADVRLIIDKRNYDRQITGDNVKVANGSYYMHNKFCVIDDFIVVTGSMNPTQRGAKLNNNNLLILNSYYLAENYYSEFEELWKGIYSKGESVINAKVESGDIVIENYFCPEDCKKSDEESRAISRIIELIKDANDSVRLASFSFTHEEIADELIKAQIRGVDVSVLIESRQRNVQNSQYKRLKDFGLNIRVDGNKYNMHHKFIVIDDNIVIAGSPNYSFSGFNRNDENMLVISNTEIAQLFVEEFDGLFLEGEVI